MKKVLFFTLLVLLLAGCNTKPTTQENTIVVKTDMEERTGEELRIMAVINIKPECIEDIKPIFQAVVIGSQEEEGCLSYNLYQDITDPTKFVMVEEWKSQAAIDFHNNTEHYKTFKAASADMVAGLDVTLMKLVY